MTDRPNRMKFGTFIAPFHTVSENPTLSMKRDMELIERCDELGYDEAWIGEHHSFARETISNPMIFIAAAAERTKHIRFGTGVVSLPYHNPLMIADDFLQLDHMTRGRVMLGVGPGALTSDAVMLGINPDTQRRRMGESLEVIIRLFAGETVTMETDWFNLTEARLQMAFYSDPPPPVSVAVMVTPAGPQLAGKFGTGLLSLTGAQDDEILPQVWEWGTESANEHGRTLDRRQWRAVMAVHIAETHEQAVADVAEGFRDRPYVGDAGTDEAGTRGAARLFGGTRSIEEAIAKDAVIVGTPEEAITSLERIQQISGGLGGLLVHAHEWANSEATCKSYELLMRYVAPRFQGQIDPLISARDHVEDRHLDIFGAAGRAVALAYLEAGKEVPEEMRELLEDHESEPQEASAAGS